MPKKQPAKRKPKKGVQVTVAPGPKPTRPAKAIPKANATKRAARKPTATKARPKLDTPREKAIAELTETVLSVSRGAVSPARKKRRRAIEDWRVTFLRCLGVTANVTAAAAAARISSKHAYEIRKQESAFMEDWDAALRAAMDDLKGEAYRRARHGTVSLKFTPKGNVVIDPRTEKPYEERTYSDTMTLTLLKAHDPAFRDKQDVKVTGLLSVSGAITAPQELLDLVRNALPGLVENIRRVSGRTIEAEP